MNSKVFSSFIWRFLERWGAQGVTLVVGIILARILDPDVYGTVALVTVFTTFLQVFVDSGLGTALIQKKDSDDIDFSSVFWFNIGICVLLYIIMYVLAPYISNFYNIPDITSVIRVLSFTIVISGVKNIQQAYVSKNLLFKKFFFATIGGTIGAAIIGVLLALLGFGVWALVAQYLFNTLVDTIILWITVKWRPKALFSFKRFKVLFSFGWKMLLSSLIDTTYNELRSLIIGKYYSSEDLAYYTKGAQFPNIAVSNINASMNSVLLPVLASKQDDVLAVKSAARRVIRVSSYIIWPLMVGLCFVADKFIIVLLTEKWSAAIIFLRILCFNQVLQPLQTTNLSVIKALGRADLHLKIEITKKAIGILIVIVSSFYGVKMIAVGSVIYAIIASIINSYPNKKLIDYGFFEQIKDILPFIIMSLIMGIGISIIGILPVPKIIGLLLQVIVGISIYYTASKLARNEELDYCINTFKSLLSHKKA